MNAQQAPVIEASSAKNISTEPKSFNLKQFPLPKDSPKKTPSPPTEIVRSLQPKKPSPSSLLSTLKSFNIDRSKYKHYGHQSMTSQSLETMMNEVHKNNIEVDTSTQKSFGETLASPLSNKLIIDEKISEILDIPPQVLDEEDVWPYNIKTLNEILHYKVEQEKTRQETIKCDFGTTAVELLKLAKSMGIDSELIPFLFITNLVSLDSLKIQIQKLKTDPDEIINAISKKCNKDDFFRKGSSSSSSSSPISDRKVPVSSKRKHSDTHLPSFSETAESIRTHSAIVSPLRSQNTLPVIVHRRIVSDNSEVLNRASNTSSPPNQQAPLPLPNYAPQHRLQQNLPQIPTQAVAQNMYPVYYPLQSGPSPPAHYQIPPPPPPQKTDQHNKALEPAYPPKYQSTNNAPQPASASGPPSGPPPIPPYQGQGYPPQQLPQYQYYGTSPTSLPHYMMQASPARMNLPPNHIPSQQHQHVPTHQFQKSPELGSGKSTVFKVADPHDDHTPNKKHKPSTKSNSINFMITTPKNPPARKYNNPHKEK